MNTWPRLKIDSQQFPDAKSPFSGEHAPVPGGQKRNQPGPYMGNKPIEPEDRKLTGPRIFKWVIFLLLIAYVLLAYYRAPILTRVGSYLIVQHPPKKADLIVCVMGEPVERGLAAAEFYKKNLAPNVFIPRENLPDGYETLREKGGNYPETRELLAIMLQGLGVPESACINSERFVGSTFDDAKVVRDLVQEKGYQSLIIVTSPTHSRRAWLTFQKVFEKDDIEIMVVPSKYTKFRSDDWWKTEGYFEEVIAEYLKLLHYSIKRFRG